MQAIKTRLDENLFSQKKMLDGNLNQMSLIFEFRPSQVPVGQVGERVTHTNYRRETKLPYKHEDTLGLLFAFQATQQVSLAMHGSSHPSCNLLAKWQWRDPHISPPQP